MGTANTQPQNNRGPLWQPERIVLARGCRDTPAAAERCERIIAAFPDAVVTAYPDLPHNRIPVPAATSAERLRAGKMTLVLGQIARPLRVSHDPETPHGTLCAPYVAFHTSWFCHYECAYCYLAGSPGVKLSPTVRIFTNLEQILGAMLRHADRASNPVSFYSGKVQDGLQLDWLTGYSRELIPRLAEHPNARLVYLTKSAQVANLLDLEHRGRVVISWSLNALQVVEWMEMGAASVTERLDAARQCRMAGYEVRFVVMPLVPFAGWEQAYCELLDQAQAVGPSRLTIGGICSYPGALSAQREALREHDPIAPLLVSEAGRRARYALATRLEMYRALVSHIRSRSDIPTSLCLETPQAWREVGLDPRRAACNCVAGECDLTR